MGTVAGVAESGARVPDELLRVLPQSPGELERVAVVVRERLRVIVRTGQGVDPGRRGPVLLSPRRSRDLPVGHVSHEQVPERVLRLSRNGRALRPLDEL